MIKGGSSRTNIPPPLPFKNFLGCDFENIDCIIRIYLNRSHHAMFTMCVLFSISLQKHKVHVYVSISNNISPPDLEGYSATNTKTHALFLK